MAMPQCCYLAKGAKRPSHTTNIQTFLNKSSSNILAVTALKANNLNSAVWDQSFIFCCMNRPRGNRSRSDELGLIEGVKPGFNTKDTMNHI